jgi:hypothetical protein
VNKPDIAIAVARELNGGVDYVSDKPAHMKALLTSLGVDWNPSRHESRQDPLP